MEIKTALEQLIEKLENMIENGGDADLLGAIQQAKQLLPIEKQQIMNGFNAGNVNGQIGLNRKAEEYFNETYKNNF